MKEGKQMKTELEQLSYEYGKNAFLNGLSSASCFDKVFMENVITGLNVGEGMPYLRAWLDGWSEANLNYTNTQKCS
jgi:hypothetical protein